MRARRLGLGRHRITRFDFRQGPKLRWISIELRRGLELSRRPEPPPRKVRVGLRRERGAGAAAAADAASRCALSPEAAAAVCWFLLSPNPFPINEGSCCRGGRCEVRRGDSGLVDDRLHEAGKPLKAEKDLPATSTVATAKATAGSGRGGGG